MARGDKEYFRVEVAFVDGPEFQSLPSDAYKLYTVLQARCIATRRVVLYGLTCRWMAAASGLSHQRVPSALAQLEGCLYGKDRQPLIKVEASANQYTIKVEGMDRNNAKFKWDDSPFVPHKKSPTRLLPDQTEPDQTKPEQTPSKPKRTPKPEPEPDVNFEKLKSFYETFPRARTNWRKSREEWDAMVKKFGVDVVMLAAKQYCEGNPDPKSRKACERFLRPENIENWSRPDAIGYRDPTTMPPNSHSVAPQSTFRGEPMARVGSGDKRGSELISAKDGFGKLLGGGE